MTTSRRDLRRKLDAAGHHPVPPPPAGFVTGLEARLAHQLGARQSLVSLPPRRRPLRPFLGGLSVIGATVALSGVLSGWYSESDAEALELQSAVDTMVVMPDGSEVAGASGLVLPDGAVVRTGPNGLASAGAVELGPGIEALVRSGRLVLHPVGGVVPAPAASVGGRDDPTSTTEPPGPSGLHTSPRSGPGPATTTPTQ